MLRFLLLALAFVVGTGAYSPDSVNSTDTIATLRNIPSTAAPFIMRMGYYVVGDAPPLVFRSSNVACSLNGGNGDGGSQVKSLDNKCWLADHADRGKVDIRQFGAKSDDATDTAPFLKAAFDAGVGIYMPGSIGVWKFGTNVTLANNRLQLTGDPPRDRVQQGTTCPTGMPDGTWIHISDTSVSPFNLSEGSGATQYDIYGSNIGNLAFCQDHPAPGPGWAPRVYPPVFNLSSVQDCHIHDIFYYGVYDGTSANNSARCTHTNIRGQVFHITWTGDHLLDATYLTNFHIWSFWSYDNSVRDWQLANGDVIFPKRVDGLRMTNVFGFAYRACLHMGDSSYGVSSGMMGAVNCDASKHAVLVDTHNTYSNVLEISHGGEDAVGSEAVQINGSAVTMQLNIFCFFVDDACVHDNSTEGNNTIQFGTAFAFGYDQRHTNKAAFLINGNQTSPTHFAFGAAPVGAYSGGANLTDDGGATGIGITSVGGWYSKRFTPVLTFGGLSTGITTSFADGSYTRNVLTQQTFGRIRMALTSKGSATGSAVIQGMPQTWFVYTAGTGSAGYYGNMLLPTAGMFGFVPEGGGPGVQLLTQNTTGTPFLAENAFQNNSTFNISFSFNN